ncbi:unnamed protein product [Allacma fusca]|uniref:MD-2-related lipid-recognition domain-containing protein n=1 Tax=Allacma fusca TaxID=39272 RepID=A0A8J2PC83_9HEXA|nr:unnamed protein product [Allacma fusca]
MLRLAVLAVLVAACSAVSVSEIRNPFIYHKALRGPVEGVVPCGSKGEVLEIRVTDCTSLPCDIKVGSTYTIEVDFIPSAGHEVLTVLVSVIRGGVENEIVHQDIPFVVAPGQGYTVSYPWTVTGQIDTGLLALRIQVKGNNGDVVELCGLATVNVSA